MAATYATQDRHVLPTTTVRPPRPLIDLSLSLPSDLHEWISRMAHDMGLPSAADYVLLLLRLEKQRQDLADIHERYRQVFRPE